MSETVGLTYEPRGAFPWVTFAKVHRRKKISQLDLSFFVKAFVVSPGSYQFKIKVCSLLSIDHELKRLRKLCPNKI
jgi:hypothetical protein